MKIILTEEQVNNLLNEYGSLPLPQKEIEKRLKKAKELAVKFPNPRQFALKYPNLWNFIRGQKLIDDVFPNRKIYKPSGFWNAENIAQEASKYNTKWEFQKNNQVAYNKGLELGIMDDLFPENHYGRKKIFDLDKSIELAKDFEGGRSQFLSKYPAAFKTLKDNDLLTSYFGPFKSGRQKQVFDDDLINQAKEYKNSRELRLNNLSLYNKLAIRGILYDVFPKMEMSNDEVIEKAKEYGTRYKLRIDNWSLFNRLKKIPNGLDMAFPKPIQPIEPVVKKEKMVKKEKYDRLRKKYIDMARKYDKRYVLRIENPNLYYKMNKMNWLNDAFPQPVEKLSLDGTLQDLLKSKEDTNQKISIEPKSPIINKNPKLPKKKLNFGKFGSLEVLTKWVAPYKTKKELERKNPLAYICVRENGLFDYFGLK